MKPEDIVTKILEAKPNLPKTEVLEKITFKWNEKDLSPWDGGYDLHEALREKVIELLEDEFKNKKIEYAKILRFLLQEEIQNCAEGQMSTTVLRTTYDHLADLKFYEDIPLLLDAAEASFDSSCALYKDRLFYNGYQKVMNYLNSNPNIDADTIGRIQYTAEYFGYDKSTQNE